MAKRKKRESEPKKRKGRPKKSESDLQEKKSKKGSKNKGSSSKKKGSSDSIYNWQEQDSVQRGLLVIFLFGVAALSLLSFVQAAGDVGVWFDRFLGWGFGWGRYIVPFILAGFGYIFLHPGKHNIKPLNYIGLVFFLLSGLALLHLAIPFGDFTQGARDGHGGGYLGIVLAFPMIKYAGIWATIVVLLGLFVGSLLIMFNWSLGELLHAMKLFGFFGGISSWFRKHAHARMNGYEIHGDEEEEGDDEDEEPEYFDADEEEDGAKSFSAKEVSEEYAGADDKDLEQMAFVPKEEPTKKKKLYTKVDLPLDLLIMRNEKPTSGDIEANKEKIRNALESFGIDVEMGEVSVGPMVSQYTLKPSDGVKLTQITTLHNDIALALAAHPIRIEAPIPGKSLVGIEVPNKAIATVAIREMLQSKSFKKRNDNLTLPLGKDVSGNGYSTSLQGMPHLLIAGATGSGKSVSINGIIISLLYQNSPQDLRLIMVDPKRVELTVYNGIPHLLTPVITNIEKTVNALKWTVAEMDRRYELLSRAGKRNIESYNDTVDAVNKMPYIVFIIDELADLMSVAANSVEAAIVRLAQMSRAVGIHLILATQRPSVNVITGLIKANMPARCAFSVTSLVDSRTILDFSGAEKLLGKGDMLYLDSKLSKPKRLQGAFVEDAEIERVVAYLREQSGEADYDNSVTEKLAQSSIPDFDGNGDADSDELLGEAKEVIFKAGKASASMLQRRLRVGYARAARILDILEEEGFIGPAEGSKPREVLATEMEIGDAPVESVRASVPGQSREVEVALEEEPAVESGDDTGPFTEDDMPMDDDAAHEEADEDSNGDRQF